MSMGTIGVEVSGRDATEIIGQIQRLEDLGVKAAWATSGGDSDPITLLAVAAVQTESILLGTSIVPTWPRHPITIAQQANVLANLAPGSLSPWELDQVTTRKCMSPSGSTSESPLPTCGNTCG